MGKYSKILDKIWRLTLGSIAILVGIAGIGVCVWGIFAISNVFFILLIAMLFGGGFLISRGIGRAFLNDQYEVTNLVMDGDSVIDVVHTPKYLKRKMWFCFIEFILYTLLTILLIYLSIVSYQNTAVLIGCAVVSAIIAFILFLVAGKTKEENFPNTKNKN